MSKIEIKVDIDATNAKHVEAACAFLQTIGATNGTAGQKAVKTAEKVVDKATQSSKSKAEKDKKTEETTIKIAEVRALLGQKKDDHFEAIKAKLTELETENVTNLAKEKYQEFMDFLKSLD